MLVNKLGGVLVDSHFVQATLLDKNPYLVQGNQDPVEETFSAKPWYSPSFSYLEIVNPLKTPAKVL